MCRRQITTVYWRLCCEWIVAPAHHAWMYFQSDTKSKDEEAKHDKTKGKAKEAEKPAKKG